VLLDLQLPDTSGLDVLAALRSRPSPPAVVVVTAHGSETAAVQALRLGADDYLVKDAALRDLLPQVVERQRRNLALRAALAAAERDLVAAERLAAIGQITVSLHHALNNPLMAASTEVELLLRGSDLSADQREALESVRASLTRIAEQVRRAAQLQAAPVVEYLEGAVSMVDLAAAPAAIRPTGRGTALITAADPGLARILGHLLGHAGFVVETCAPTDLATRLAPGQPRARAVILQAGAVAATALPTTASLPLVVAVGSAAALGEFEGKVAFTVAIPFDPGVMVQEIIARLERGIP
ncbi:MAG: response regulator, partial [Gemmatimonadales bacterium]